MRVKETCACGGEVDVECDTSPGPAVRDWRERHQCDRRPTPAGPDPAVVTVAAAAAGKPAVGFGS